MKYRIRQACRKHLLHTFGLKAYRPGQKEAVYSLLSGRDVMGILPTGAGKSLCWQLPAVVHDGLTLVITPLIALMQDQVQHLQARGIAAACLNSLMLPEERRQIMEQVSAGAIRILFAAPERLEQEQFRKLCHACIPWLMVIDEAHCIVQWGESFRPAYTMIGEFVQSLPVRPVICALTATADAAMVKAIRASLGMRHEKRILLPVLRENLCYHAYTTLNRTDSIIRCCREQHGKVIIFCRYRVRAERLAAMLAAQGLPAGFYHAGMDKADRNAVQEQFRRSENMSLCATSAFGMGVDIPDIRSVVHDGLPETLTDYVQQSGRAGRDGKPAQCSLFLEPCDLIRRYREASSLRKKLWQHPFKNGKKLLAVRSNTRRLMKVLFQSECVAAAISAAYGWRISACGRCSSCEKQEKMPTLPAWNNEEWAVRLWFLLWQRKVLARQRGVLPGQILPDFALETAATKYAFPDETQVPPEMERLLRHFIERKTHPEG